MPNAARPALTFGTGDTRGALPRWLRFFVVLLPVPDLLFFAKHLFAAATPLAARGVATEPDAVRSSTRAVDGPRSLASQIKPPVGSEIELGGDAILDQLRVVTVFVAWRDFLIRGEFPASDHLAFAELHGLEDSVVCHDVGLR